MGEQVKRPRRETTRDRVEAALIAPLAALGLDVEQVELGPVGKRRLLRVAVDADGGVTLDAVAEATREVGRVLDESDVMGEHPYTLEVSSRGVDSPLTLPRHWRRNAGRLVKVTLTDGSTRIGRIQTCTDRAVSLEDEGRVADLAFDRIDKALVQIEFNRAEKDGD